METKQLWHDNTEEPIVLKDIIFLTSQDRIVAGYRDVAIKDRHGNTISYLADMEGFRRWDKKEIVAWAYIDDLVKATRNNGVNND